MNLRGWLAVTPLLLALGPISCNQKSTPPPALPIELPRIELRRMPDGHVFVVAGLEPITHSRRNWARLTPQQWQLYFIVRVTAGDGTPASAVQPMLGVYSVLNGEFVFQPRFPLRPGLIYRAEFAGQGLADAASGGAAGSSPKPSNDDYLALFVPGPALTTPATHVTGVFPSRTQLPENLLKFYFHFSAPMNRGEAYRHIRLLDAAGKEIDGAFLELAEELWNAEQTRFTLLFDPGRIKRELLPRELIGPALENGKSYSLVLDRAWEDAQSQPLMVEHRKAFRVGPPDEKQPDPQSWKLTAPPAGSSQPLVVEFPEALDHALLERLLRVVDAAGQPCAGQIAVGNEETRWEFTPLTPWKAGAHYLEAETILEDLAGNSIAKPFEVDLFRPIQRRVEVSRVRVEFVVK